MRNNSEDLIRLAGQEFGRLTDADKKLFRAVARHEVANLKANLDELRNLSLNTVLFIWLLLRQYNCMAGILFIFQSLNKPELAEQWGTERTLKADRIVWLLTNPEAIKLLSFRGLRISGAKIEGELNLEYATVFVPLIFDACAFTEPLILQKSKLRELQMPGSYVSGIQATEMRVEGSIYLNNGFKSEGEVNLIRVSIGGLLSCTGGKFSNQGQTAINAAVATITADVFLSNGFEAKGMVNLFGVSIGGLLNCSGGKFSNQGKTAINANGAIIAASVYLRNGFNTEGEVNLVRASIGGQLSCIGGKFTNQGKTAIQAATATITADVFLSDDFEAEGEVNLCQASIGGVLNCTKGNFSNQGGTAITANAATIATSVFLSNGFKAEGEVNLLRACIGGDIYCMGGQFLNTTGNALNAEGTKISGSVFLGGKSNNSQFQAEGKMTFPNATIGNRFELIHLESNKFTSKHLPLNTIPIIWLLLQRINSEAGILFLLKPSIKLDLRFAKVNTFSFKDSDAEESWMKQIKHGELFLNGFVYSSINVTNTFITINDKNFFKWLWLKIKKDSHVHKNHDILKWLRLQIKKGSNSQSEENSDPQSENGFVLQPYEQLAKVLRANGHQEAATEVLIAKEEDRRRYGDLKGWGKFWNRILGLAIAHGYRPEKALIYSVIVILIGWGVFFLNQGLMIPTKYAEDKPYAVFNPLVYSIDTFTPIIDLYQQKMFLPNASEGERRGIVWKKRPGDWLRRYFWFQIIAGWVLTSLWVAGFTGLVRSKK